ncbi:MAG: hypothetical protein KAJ81_03270, partial [Candidatus Latescibacteria bacterium]|nr:hypothetical protein [Candidatus Latescibacterota bacterium]
MTVEAVFPPPKQEGARLERTKVSNKRVGRLSAIERRGNQPIHDRIIGRPPGNAKPNPLRGLDRSGSITA